ncbi:MAG TPA: radical SAM protein [bacterium]|mgnify:CR=1 FL=1|nr:radical SAM protein [bacterium]HOL47519.1 radical SAM protein [bacterium]HPQ18825.1 radical SAM protein [bacterium]
MISIKDKYKFLFYLYDFDDEPLGILYLSSILKKFNFDVDIVLTKYEDYKKITREYAPDFAAFTVTTGYDIYYLELIKELKKIKEDIITILGGPHCTFFPEIIEEENIDIICRGEGELALIKFCENLKNKNDIYQTPNFYFKKNNEIIKNDITSLVSNLDELPQPDRKLLTKYKFYRLANKKDFITGRGCPFNCSYCFNHAFNKMYRGKGKIIRKHSVDYVIEQIKELQKYSNIKFIQFVDDIFIIDKEWLEEFAEKYPAKIGIPYNCNVRVDYIDDYKISLLKKSNCHSISMGIEAGDEEVRNKILKRNLKDKEIIEASKIIKSYKIKLATQNIVGIPGGSLEKDIKTMRLNAICKTDYAWCTIYQPYPGVELTELAIKLNLFDGDRRFISRSFHEDTILNIADKLETINLHKLFGIGAEFIFLENLIRFLIKLPLTKIYSLLRKVWNLYCYKFRINKNISIREIYWKSIKKEL